METPIIGYTVWYSPTVRELDNFSGIDYDEVYENGGYIEATIIGVDDGLADLELHTQGEHIKGSVGYDDQLSSGTWKYPKTN